jgi:hypothetical protein
MVGDETYSISRKKACDVFNGTPVGRAVDFRFWPATASRACEKTSATLWVQLLRSDQPPEITASGIW